MTHALFIYGTLMPGLRLASEMQGAVFLGAAQVQGRLIDVGQYPGLLPGVGQVVGEVYEVDHAHLARLDGVEEMVPGDRVASQYWREGVTVTGGPLQGLRVQAYFYNHPDPSGQPIPHGDYRRYIREIGRDS
jgi:gamma-glutamylcyclotransferase (GGCT)/AIG2-like uncharacterized protein YtfP